jgi:hypothetical protein
MLAPGLAISRKRSRRKEPAGRDPGDAGDSACACEQKWRERERKNKGAAMDRRWWGGMEGGFALLRSRTQGHHQQEIMLIS